MAGPLKRDADAHDTRLHFMRARDAQIAALSNRTRTLCLGGLVVIWELLVKHENNSLQLHALEKTCCLICALLIVLVLALDISEYLISLQAYRELAGDVNASRLDLFGIQHRLIGVKLSVGLITLLGVCAVLGYVLSEVPVHAQTTDEVLLGKWCGRENDNKNQNGYACIEITRLTEQLYIRLSFDQEEHDWHPCEAIEYNRLENPKHLEAKCEDRWITNSNLNGARLDTTITDNETTDEAKKQISFGQKKVP